MQKIDVKVVNKKVGELSFEKEHHRYIFNYTQECVPISLIMPCRDEYLGFEEILTLLGKNKEEKYKGSYWTACLD